MSNKKTCTWKVVYFDDCGQCGSCEASIVTECGKSIDLKPWGFEYNEELGYFPIPDEFKYCCYCGKPIEDGGRQKGKL